MDDNKKDKFEEAEQNNDHTNDNKLLPKRNRSKVLMIEIGGNYNPNVYIDFLFVLFVDSSLILGLISVFDLARYNNVLVLVGLASSFTITEYVLREFLYTYLSRLVILSFGTIFYLVYAIYFYMFDHLVSNSLFQFNSGTIFILFVTLFSLIRFVVSSYIKYQFRLRRFYKQIYKSGDHNAG